MRVRNTYQLSLELSQLRIFFLGAAILVVRHGRGKGKLKDR